MKRGDIKVITIQRTSGRKDNVPCISFSGKYLINLGFNIHDRIVISPRKDGHLDIQKL